MWRCVDRHVGILLVTLFCSCAISTTAQSPSFLSIDCGSEVNYTDSIGIDWVTDAGYIFSGSIVAVSVTVARGQEPFLNSRYFPETRSKHCYVIPAVVDTTYLVRVVMVHGGAPELPLPVEFDVTINSNIWFTHTLDVDDSSISVPISTEAIFFNQRDHIDVCLNEARSGIPWISTLELRALPSSTYNLARTGDKFLNNVYRGNSGFDKDTIVRWPDDELDRCWMPTSGSLLYPNMKRVANSTVLPFSKTSVEGYNQPPEAVMVDAFFGLDLNYDWLRASDAPALEEIYVATYFQDIRNSTANASNPVGILVGDPAAMYKVNLTDGFPIQSHFVTNATGTRYNITIVPQPWYDGEAFVNAFEIYSLTPISSVFTLGKDVTALQILKKSFGLTSWTGDPCYPVSYDWLKCDASNQIAVLFLSNKNIVGTIPPEIEDLTNLREIYLDNNQIGGSIPSSLGSLPGLTVLALDNNSLSGGIPTVFQNKAGFTFSGNPNLTLCQATDTDCNNATSDEKSNNTGLLVGLVVGIVIAVLLAIALIVFFVRRRKSKPTPDSIEGAGEYANHSGPLIGAGNTDSFDNSARISDPRGDGSSNSAAKANSYQVAGFMSMKEVLAATRNREKKIGEGGYGPVYYGKLPNGEEVAVKVNKLGAHQGNDEFVNEVRLLTRVHHRNLVSLLGFCEEGTDRVLIYEFQHNGTLSDLLYGSNAASRPLSWKTRLEIALDAGRGLEYLHNGSNPPIIHRDIKSNNILVNDRMVAKVADFGISKATEEKTGGDGHYSTVVKGTLGYLDPEYFELQKLSQKSDVYSFGVVLLEIMAGRRPISLSPDGTQFSIITLMRHCMETGDIGGIVDPALNGEFNMESMWKVAEIACSSVERIGANRPHMSQVIRGLTEAYEMEVSYNPDNPSMEMSYQLNPRT